MKLIPSEFTHIEDASNYNHNYYLHNKHNYKILEVSDDNVCLSYYIVDVDKEIYIGSHIGQEGLDGFNCIDLV
jgi:hypothetical protein